MKSYTVRTLKERWKTGTFGEIFEDWKWIFSYSRLFKRSIAAYTVLGLFSSTLGLVSAIAGKFLVDVVTGHKADRLWQAALLMAGSTLLSMGTSNLIGRIRQKLDVDMANAIRADVFGSVMDAGFDQIYNLYNSQVYSVSDIIDTWVYRTGLEQLNYSTATAVGLFKSIISTALVFSVNAITRRWEESLW